MNTTEFDESPTVLANAADRRGAMRALMATGMALLASLVAGGAEAKKQERGGNRNGHRPQGSADQTSERKKKKKRGAVGPTGPTGPAGPAGGPAGGQAETGPTGPAGPTGDTGDTGPQGETGQDGADGQDGATGPTGPIGASGPAGPPGAQGQPGEEGKQGPTGPAGDNGPAGETGPKGDTGAAGDAGAQGPTGPTGAQGEAGPTGPAGTSGAQTARVPQSESTTSTTYTDLDTVGPSVPVSIPASGQVLVTLTARIFVVPGTSGFMSFDSSGGSGNVSASDSRALDLESLGASAAGVSVQSSATFLVTSLSAGSHTFVARYRKSGAGGEVHFQNRSLVVIPLP